MKKILTLAVAFVFALSLAGVALAQDAMTNAPAPAKKMKKAKVKFMRVYGTVSSVDTTASTITVKGKKGEVTLTTDEKTVIKKAKEKITLADIKAGDKVYARYSKVEGKNLAKYISVRVPKKAKKKAKAAEAAPESK